MARAKENPVTSVGSVEEVIVVPDVKLEEVKEVSNTEVAVVATRGDIYIAKAFMADPSKFTLGATKVEVEVEAPEGLVCVCVLTDRLINMTKIRFATFPKFVGTGKAQKLTLHIDNFGNDGMMFTKETVLGNWEVLK